MDQSNFHELFEKCFILLEIDQLSFDAIVNRYSRVLDLIFRDHIYSHGRFFAVDYFAIYIANRVSHVDSYHLLKALRERLDEKWPSSSDSSNHYSE